MYHSNAPEASESPVSSDNDCHIMYERGSSGTITESGADSCSIDVQLVSLAPCFA